MQKTNHTENPNIGIPAEITSKRNTELLDEIDAMLENSPAEDIDIDLLLENLDTLQERNPVMQGYQPREAWQKIAEKLSADQQEDAVPPAKNPPEKKTGSKILRWAQIAAVLLLFLGVTANALGYHPVQSFIQWADDVIFAYSNPSGLLELPEDSASQYHSLREALDKNGAEDAWCPTWIPEDYALSSITVQQIGHVTSISAIFTAIRGDILISIEDRNNLSWNNSVELSPTPGAITKRIGDIEFSFVYNKDYIKAFWETSEFSYIIYGNITEDEIVKILQFI